MKLYEWDLMSSIIDNWIEWYIICTYTHIWHRTCQRKRAVRKLRSGCQECDSTCVPSDIWMLFLSWMLRNGVWENHSQLSRFTHEVRSLTTQKILQEIVHFWWLMKLASKILLWLWIKNPAHEWPNFRPPKYCFDRVWPKVWIVKNLSNLFVKDL